MRSYQLHTTRLNVRIMKTRHGYKNARDSLELSEGDLKLVMVSGVGERNVQE